MEYHRDLYSDPCCLYYFFNDFPDILRKCNVIQYADDTVIYFACRSKATLINTLTEELDNIAKYLDENELIINLKKGKTEVMILGTAKRLGKDDEADLNVKYGDKTVTRVTTYKYLGLIIESSLNFQEHFQRSYRKASSKLGLLERIRLNLTPTARRLIYQMMILPLLTYSSVVNLNLTPTNIYLLKNLSRRAEQIINDGERVNEIENEIKKQSCKFVRKCLDGKVCSNFINYFELQNHEFNTRNNAAAIKLPKVKLSCAKKAFYFTGAKTYNDLPMNIRKEENFKAYVKMLKYHFANQWNLFSNLFFFKFCTYYLYIYWFSA